jgi:membrane protein implicated in regulation of membrane protease activity
MEGTPVGRALIYSVLWGLAALVIVSYVFYKLAALQEVGNASLSTAVGQTATVYADIPQNGSGKIRVLVSGVVTVVTARSKDGLPLMAGTEVKVLRIMGPNILEVEKTKKAEGA